MTFRERLATMQNAGGNHEAQTVKGIVQEGQKSYLKVMDNSIGTNKAPDPNNKKFSHITPPPAPKIQPKPMTPKR